MNNIQALKERVMQEITALEKRIDKYDDRIEIIENGGQDRHGRSLEWLEKRADKAYDRLDALNMVWNYIKDF